MDQQDSDVINKIRGSSNEFASTNLELVIGTLMDEKKSLIAENIDFENRTESILIETSGLPRFRGKEQNRRKVRQIIQQE